MTALLLEPHQDDCALFAAFTAHAEKPHVVTVLRSVVQERRGISGQTREWENKHAMHELGCQWGQWPFSDSDPDWDAIRDAIVGAAATYGRVLAPHPEDGGHEHHNRIGEIAREAFGAGRVTCYVTYANGRQRNNDGLGEKVIPTPDAVQAKLRALACYRSQIAEPSTGHHFTDHPLTEWIVR